MIPAAIAGILASNTAHLLSVLVLYQLTLLVAAHPPSRESSSVALISASLHIISPAGLFLSAPYAESFFSLLNFAGFYLYAFSLHVHQNKRPSLRDVTILLSGSLFGVATTFRSNGLLSGLIFCVDLLRIIVGLKSGTPSGDLMSSLRQSVVLVVAGCIMAFGSLFPQYLAYHEYCVSSELHYRPSWCTRRLPSIYTSVQSRYWYFSKLFQVCTTN